MVSIDDYLKSHKHEIVDYINSNYIPSNITIDPTFNRLASELQGKFKHNHSGQEGGRDQVHNVLAMASICSQMRKATYDPYRLQKAYQNACRFHESGSRK